jgi:hypothetical protein
VRGAQSIQRLVVETLYALERGEARLESHRRNCNDCIGGPGHGATLTGSAIIVKGT